MEAANRGTFDAGARSIGLNIKLQHEQAPNPFITPGLFEEGFINAQDVHLFTAVDTAEEIVCVLHTFYDGKPPVNIVTPN